MLDAIKGFESGDMFTAIPKALIPKEPYASFVVTDADVQHKPLKGMRVGVVREFMVKHTKNDAAISDQIDKEIKTVLRDKLGAELVESVDPLYPDDPDRSEHEVHVPGRVRGDPAAQRAGIFLAEDATGELEFAVPGWDVTTVDYAVALALGKAPLSDKINLRRISARLGNPKSPFTMNKYLRERGDERVKDWASWVANAKLEERRAARRRRERRRRSRSARRARIDELPEDADGAADDRSQGDVRERHRCVRESGEHAPAVKLGGAGEPGINRRPAMQLLRSVHGASRRSGDRCARRLHSRPCYEPQYVLSADKKEYEAVTGTVQSKLPHPMPISLMFWAGPGSDPTVIKVASAYEAATHHRVPPPAFGPLPQATHRQIASLFSAVSPTG